MDDGQTAAQESVTTDAYEAFSFAPGQSIAYLARDITRLFSRALQNRIQPHGILIGQYHFLRVLWEGDGITQRELATQVGMKESTTFTALAGMEAKGLVRRSRHPTDRRKMLVWLTPEGKRLKQVLLPIAKEVNDITAEVLDSDDIGQLRSLLIELKRALESQSQKK
ncbi:MAG: MarR family transcriptional regulator [Gammaproteobacteria bacterium]|nr:MarR family transcriptional regulator [Gammaproteobacteria bacterium]